MALECGKYGCSSFLPGQYLLFYWHLECGSTWMWQEYNKVTSKKMFILTSKLILTFVFLDALNLRQ